MKTLVNAKDELIQKLEEYGYGIEEIKCYRITISKSALLLEKTKIKDENNLLCKGYDHKKLFEFLDFEYDDGYGLQLIDGIVLMFDGNWFEREEYDGSEWWTFRKPLTCKDILGDENE